MNDERYLYDPETWDDIRLWLGEDLLSVGANSYENRFNAIELSTRFEDLGARLPYKMRIYATETVEFTFKDSEGWALSYKLRDDGTFFYIRSSSDESETNFKFMDTPKYTSTMLIPLSDQLIDQSIKV